MKQILIIGCGDIGARVAQLWLARKVPVTGVVRTHAHAAQLRAQGMAVQQCDLDAEGACGTASTDGGVYYFAPPAETGEGDDRLQRWLSSLQDVPRKLVYISTTGVYGDTGGAWVDEDTPPHPQTDRARRRLDAERQLERWTADRRVALVILRVAGIYGPGRLPLAALQRGQPVLRRELSPYSNRIHADDLAQVCLAAMENEHARGIYNVCDGEESTMSDYYRQVAAALGLPAPREIDWDEARRTFSPTLLSYLSESRRVSNRRMREELGVRLRYPTLAQGLAAC